MPTTSSSASRFFLSWLPEAVRRSEHAAPRPRRRRRRWPRRRRRWRKSLVKTPAGAVAFTNVQRVRRRRQDVPRRSDRHRRQGPDRRGRPGEVSARCRRARRSSTAAARRCCPACGTATCTWATTTPGLQELSMGVTSMRDPGNDDSQTIDRRERAARGRAAVAARVCLVAHRRQGHVHRAGGQRRDQRGGGDRARRQGEGEWLHRREVLRHA